MMSCERATTEEYCVVVKVPKSLSARCGECCRGVGRTFPLFLVCCISIIVTIIGIGILITIVMSFWIFIMLNYCHKTPGLGLEDVTIRDMVVYQNTTTATTDTPWQVKSDITVNLSAWNPNTVAKCFETYHRIVVQVEYKGQQILQQEVPLELGFKRRQKHPVILNLHGDHFPLQTELGSLLELDLRNASTVRLQFSFNVRYIQSDRKATWMGMGCDVIAKTPANINFSQVNATGTLVSSSCQAI